MTLWLTRILPDLGNRVAHHDLSDAIRLHKRIMSLLPDGLGDNARQQAGVLYRLEHTRIGTHLLVQTNLKPEIRKLPNGYGAADVRDLGPLLRALDKGSLVRYRLAANASKRLGRTAEHPGKIVALSGQAAEQWWTGRAERYGLALRAMTSTSMADAVGRHENTGLVKHAIVRFDGTALVTDPDALRAAVRDGIGRGKSYGCGLLSLALAAR
ncbi:type I-E CRISPR-associated protein Cas6/Cse3/CasE [Actinomadura kijaniata]|uniref:type I-E CRISPR-associated protein Cas6/Cse3/CasE n=1 Tax=Actinomadura kijaniata TaxID=46161 RepID=UPI003F1938B2